MENKTISKKISSYNKITELLVKENDYLHIMKGYCENSMNESEAAARILLILETVCTIHEELYDKIDDLIIETGL